MAHEQWMSNVAQIVGNTTGILLDASGIGPAGEIGKDIFAEFLEKLNNNTDFHVNYNDAYDITVFGYVTTNNGFYAYFDPQLDRYIVEWFNGFIEH